MVSDAITLKSSPIPTNNGDLFFATKIVSLSSLSIKPKAYEPSNNEITLEKAASVVKPSFENVQPIAQSLLYQFQI